MDTTCTRLHENLMHFIIILLCAVEKKLPPLLPLLRPKAMAIKVNKTTNQQSSQVAKAGILLKAKRVAGCSPLFAPEFREHEGLWLKISSPDAWPFFHVDLVVVAGNP